MQFSAVLRNGGTRRESRQAHRYHRCLPCSARSFSLKTEEEEHSYDHHVLYSLSD